MNCPLRKAIWWRKTSQSCAGKGEGNPMWAPPIEQPAPGLEAVCGGLRSRISSESEGGLMSTDL